MTKMNENIKYDNKIPAKPELKNMMNIASPTSNPPTA